MVSNFFVFSRIRVSQKNSQIHGNVYLGTFFWGYVLKSWKGFSLQLAGRSNGFAADGFFNMLLKRDDFYVTDNR